MDVLATCGRPFAGPWKLSDPASRDADASRIDELDDDAVRRVLECGVARNYDGEPFPKDGYGATLVSGLVDGVGVSVGLHVGATVNRYVVNELTATQQAVVPGPTVDLRDSFGRHQVEVLQRLVDIWSPDLAQVTVRDASRSQRRFTTLVGLTNYFRGDHSAFLAALELPAVVHTEVAKGGTWLRVELSDDDLVSTVASIVATADVIEDAGGLPVTP
ncbi:hypothetical protein [Curtobacterium pusillum]|uniref:Uncharacterized protein n=1 Tax=Curtobacterium pusillum TaxID=69373 RepID=A0ABX2M3P7_9MICO|nr:hypothetical protein [Curtobacterium pusillum]NUU12765.1 hypothetical protein [Curtobacterium pusillum]